MTTCKIPAAILAIFLSAQVSGRGGDLGQAQAALNGVGAVAAKPITIVNGRSGDARVLVRDNRLVFSAGGGKEVAVSEPFLTSSTDWRPVGDINCSWSPDGKFLAVFIPHPRVTVISVVNLPKREVMTEVFPDDRKYPSWYGHIFSTKDTPLGWRDGKLAIRTDVVTGSGERKQMERELSVQDGTFQVLFCGERD